MGRRPGIPAVATFPVVYLLFYKCRDGDHIRPTSRFDGFAIDGAADVSKRCTVQARALRSNASLFPGNSPTVEGPGASERKSFESAVSRRSFTPLKKLCALLCLLVNAIG